ncbi:DUF6303 family protein [Streptomyces sp. NPDC050428]|uniref:DUF6303 family protein n=1 Tax=Streptomyces sp. NPDC050428 TaxID=3155757 RepID=UPI0034253690
MNQSTARTEFRAQMTQTRNGRYWEIYVVLHGVPHWPDVQLPASAGVPTVAVRTAALRELGYAPKAAHGRWDWIEFNTIGDRVDLIALVIVVPLNPRGAAR